jgi:lipoprotein-releasing system ATP-binding protein
MDNREGTVQDIDGYRDHATDSPLIRASDITKVYNHNGTRIEVLHRLSFKLDHRETVGIVGASGIGKSTLLHVLGTLDRPDSGRLEYSGQDVMALDDIKLARFRNRTIGFVFQFHHLLPEFSALENTMMPVLIGGAEKKAAITAADTILVRVGLKDRLNHRAGELSGGEQQRVALARALVQRPAILLADETTGNLDRANSDQIHELLMDLNREMGMALVVVTHNMDLASLMSRRVTIANGMLEEFAGPEST